MWIPTTIRTNCFQGGPCTWLSGILMMHDATLFLSHRILYPKHFHVHSNYANNLYKISLFLSHTCEYVTHFFFFLFLFEYAQTKKKKIKIKTPIKLVLLPIRELHYTNKLIKLRVKGEKVLINVSKLWLTPMSSGKSLIEA